MPIFFKTQSLCSLRFLRLNKNRRRSPCASFSGGRFAGISFSLEVTPAEERLKTPVPAETSKTSTKKTTRAKKHAGKLSELETGVVEFFSEFSKIFGLPASVAQIYGLLYCSDTPVTFEKIRRRLAISQGSISQGLRYLQAQGMVRATQEKGVRHKKFEPETSLGRFMQLFLHEQVVPKLDAGKARLREIEKLVGNKEKLSPELSARLRRLDGWTSRAHELLPALRQLLAGTGA